MVCSLASTGLPDLMEVWAGMWCVFFQAEDGIRDIGVTGVQTCALPISVGAALAGAEVDVVAQVGSTATGRSIAAACARTGAKALLENGGSDPLIVDADVDPVWAAQQAALGAFANSGQICVAVERIYAHRDVAGAFVEALAAEADKWAGDIGPLVDRRLRDTVDAQVRAAVDAGARVV